MKLMTALQEKQLRANAAIAVASGDGSSMQPVIRLFAPGAAGTWLFSELHEDGRLFGLCDLGVGTPELGYASLEELRAVRVPPFGLPIERDEDFAADRTMGEYTQRARAAGRIID